MMISSEVDTDIDQTQLLSDRYNRVSEVVGMNSACIVEAKVIVHNRSVKVKADADV